MATVAEYATAHVFKLLEELPPTDELTYNRKLAALWDWVVWDLDVYLYVCYVSHVTLPYHKRQYKQLVTQRPIRQAAVQVFLNVHAPAYERHVKRAIEQRYRWWWDRLLELDEEEAEEA